MKTYNEKDILAFLNKFFTEVNNNTNKSYKKIVEYVEFNESIQCWVATINDTFSNYYPDYSGGVSHDYEDNFSEIILGPKGILSYVDLTPQEEKDLSSKWLEELKKKKEKGSESNE